MTPPERPEVAAHNEVQRLIAELDHALIESRWSKDTKRQWLRSFIASDLSQLVRATAAEPLRGALKWEIAFLRSVIAAGETLTDEDNARIDVALEATAPSTPEPALDVERLARAIDIAGTFKQDEDDWAVTRPKHPSELAADIAREYAALTSEPRATGKSRE